jgi:hypothetical protein
MPRLLAALAVLRGAAAQHGYGPNFGECTCETFCDKR